MVCISIFPIYGILFPNRFACCTITISVPYSFEQGGATGAGIRSQPRLSGEGSFVLTKYINWCDKLYAAIDCYCWVFSNAYLAPCEVFNCECLNK